MIGKVEKVERDKEMVTLTIKLRGPITLESHNVTFTHIKLSMMEDDYKAHGEPKEGDEFKPAFTFFKFGKVEGEIFTT